MPPSLTSVSTLYSCFSNATTNCLCWPFWHPSTLTGEGTCTVCSFTPIDMVTMSMMSNSGGLHCIVGKYSLHSHSFIFGRGKGFRRKNLHMDLTEDWIQDPLYRSPVCEIWNYNSFVVEDSGLCGFMPCWLVVVVLEDCCACKVTVSTNQLTCCNNPEELILQNPLSYSKTAIFLQHVYR